MGIQLWSALFISLFTLLGSIESLASPGQCQYVLENGEPFLVHQRRFTASVNDFYPAGEVSASAPGIYHFVLNTHVSPRIFPLKTTAFVRENNELLRDALLARKNEPSREKRNKFRVSGAFIRGEDGLFYFRIDSVWNSEIREFSSNTEWKNPENTVIPFPQSGASQ